MSSLAMTAGVGLEDDEVLERSVEWTPNIPPNRLSRCREIWTNPVRGQFDLDFPSARLVVDRTRSLNQGAQWMADYLLPNAPWRRGLADDEVDALTNVNWAMSKDAESLTLT